jgi:hypothetical protein
MYKKLKFLIVAVVILFAGTTTFAQHLPKFQIIANLNYATPTSSAFKDYSNGGIGAEAGAGLGFKNTMLMGTLGYQTFGNTSANPAGNLKITTIKAGLRQYFLRSHLFALGNIGSAIQNYSSSTVSGSNVIYEFGAGVRLFGIEVQLTQSSWQQPIALPTSKAFNVKVGFSFKI